MYSWLISGMEYILIQYLWVFSLANYCEANWIWQFVRQVGKSMCLHESLSRTLASHQPHSRPERNPYNKWSLLKTPQSKGESRGFTRCGSSSVRKSCKCELLKWRSLRNFLLVWVHVENHLQPCTCPSRIPILSPKLFMEAACHVWACFEREASTKSFDFAFCSNVAAVA